MAEQEIAIKLGELESRSKSNTHRLDKVEEKLENNERMLNGLSVIAQRQDTMDSDIKEIKTDVKVLTSKPIKRWEGVVAAVISAAVGGIVTFILVKIGIAM